LHSKLKASLPEFTYYDYYSVTGADTLIVTFGVTARAAQAALKKLEGSQHPASLLVLKTLWPVPEALIREKAGPYTRVLVVEMNLGQYLREIQRVLPAAKVEFLGQMNGELIKPDQIVEVILHG
jgi:2-oxoglutarate ferredoxin oxidoreductase subunit alpha